MIAFDSLGTRSMATYAETKSVRIFIDPGVSLAPVRYGLPIHPIEQQRMDDHWSEIVKYAGDSDVLVVTHLHYDHHNPDEDLGIYKGKVVLVKHPTENINFSQRRRAAYFLDRIKGLPERLEYADGREFQFGRTKVKFSPPVFHGPGKRLGYVVEVLVDDGEYRMLHTSDVEGPSLPNQVDFVVNCKPNLVILDGPLSYMLGYRYGFQSLSASIGNMARIVGECPIDALVVDHHLLRDLRWRDRIPEVFEAARDKGAKVLTAAEYAGKPIEMLEARRRELWQKGGMD